MMKKFTFLIVSYLVCLVLASCQKTEPEPECKLKDFPYEIFEVEKMKYGHTIQMYIVERGRNKDKRQ